jgi:hypothetical protein
LRGLLTGLREIVHSYRIGSGAPLASPRSRAKKPPRLRTLSPCGKERGACGYESAMSSRRPALP